MQLQDRKAEIATLETQLRYYEHLLDESNRNNELLAKTKIIFHDLKWIYQKLIELKKIIKIDYDTQESKIPVISNEPKIQLTNIREVE